MDNFQLNRAIRAPFLGALLAGTIGMSIWGMCGGWNPALAEDADTDLFSSGPQAQDHQQLSARQEEANQAYNQYFDALMSKSKEGVGSAQANINQSESRVGNILNEQHEKTLGMIFGRVYFPDGSSVSIPEYEKDPQKFASRELPPVDIAGTSPVSNDSKRSPAASSITFGSPNSIERNEITLDGGNIPKEFTFSHKEGSRKKDSTHQKTSKKPIGQ